MILPSGSKVELGIECQHPFTSGIGWPKDGGNAYLDFGNAGHDAQEGYVRCEAVDLDAIADARGLTVTDRRRLYSVAENVRLRIEGLIADGWMLFPEVAVAFHVMSGTGRLMRKAHHRDYSDARPGELSGTIDIIGVRPGEVFISDLKTGRWKTRDGMAWQLRFGAVAVASILGADSVHAALWYVDEEEIRDDEGTLDWLDLRETADALRALWPKLTSGPTPPVPGPHCVDMYCPLLGKCAATRAALAEVRSSEAVRVDTPEQAARVWQMLPIIEAAAKSAKEQIKAMALRDGSIPLPNGKRLVVVQQSRDTVVLSPAAVELVKRAGAEEALEMGTSKAALERAIGKKDAKGLVDALRGVGAIKTSTFDYPKEVE